MSTLFEGEFKAKAVELDLGMNNKGAPEVRVTMEILDGQHAGSRVPYSGKFGEKAIKWTKMDLVALGWGGKNIDTLRDDVMRAPRIVPIKVEIASYVYPDTGKKREWTSVRAIGERGGTSEPLKPLDKQAAIDVQKWLTEDSGGHSDIPF